MCPLPPILSRFTCGIPTFAFKTISWILAYALASTVTDAQSASRMEAHWAATPIFSPCTFPVPSSASRLDEYRRVCHVNRHLPFICDLHEALDNNGFYYVAKSYAKHKSVLTENGTFLVGVVIARQLATPVSSEFVTPENSEFGCLFRSACQVMTPDTVEKFVTNIRTFTKVYTAALFSRWFTRTDTCIRPRVLALLVLDGVVSDPRKLSSVNLFTDDHLLNPFITNIALESTNSIFQGVPLPEVVADLVDQLGYAFRDYHATKGRPRRHPIPLWAWIVSGVSVSLVVVALLVEWYIVRRKLASKRSIPGLPTDAVRSKTHMMF